MLCHSPVMPEIILCMVLGAYSQIGQPGYTEILIGLVDGAQLEGLRGLLFIDTHVKVAE